jgi:thiamine-monophosphate kinase
VAEGSAGRPSPQGAPRDAPSPPRGRVLLGRGGEFDLIRRFLAADESDLPAEVHLGPGDDAALLDGGWVVSTDLSVEDVHFRRRWLTDREIGYRAAAAALSDLAAMAARPVGVLLSLALPPAAEVDAEEVQAGVREAATSVGAVVIGGDLSASPGPLVLDVVVVGRAERARLRVGARPGDEVWVTGALGASAAAVALWERGDEPAQVLRAAFAHPVPRVGVGSALAALGEGALVALVDVSDGLAGDAGHLAAAGGVRVVLEVGSIPVAGAARTALGEAGALEAALYGGEDYELLFASRPGAFERAAAEGAAGLPLTRVGRVEQGKGVWLERVDGSVVPVARGGFSHVEEGP